MHDLLIPDVAQLEKWLHEEGHETHTCSQCHGLHLSKLQEQEGVIESRLFVEPWGVLFTSEIEIRSSAVFVVAADMARMNMSYPTLKVFLETPEQGGAVLMVSSPLLITQGITELQFKEFFGVNYETLLQLLSDCRQLQFVASDEEELLAAPDSVDGIPTSLH